MPIGAVVCGPKAATVLGPGNHGTTFGGNPLAMAVGNAVLDIVLAPDFLPHVEKVANFARQQLAGLVAAHPRVFEDVRGEGLMLGLKMRVQNTEFLSRLFAHKMLAVGAGDNVVRLLPPLIIEESDMREALNLLSETAESFETP